MRLGERTRLTKIGELTQDRQHPELTPETRIMYLDFSMSLPLWYPVTQSLSTNRNNTLRRFEFSIILINVKKMFLKRDGCRLEFTVLKVLNYH